ncbi:DUF455 domain protein [Hypoxylon sp. FL1284]|nr:DUF455 domain protein [Hypoxylon sp. FL1284]
MQGFNMGRYVPPDVEGTTTGNNLHRKKPPGISRDGAQQTVRFEMPFAVWCGHCAPPTIIGQGVRFNAAKRRVGFYHSTPVFAFRMRHADCGGAIEIRTDPQHTAYVVVEGGKKRDTGEDNDDEKPTGLEPILTDRERDALRSDAFAKLERTIEDRRALEGARDRLGALADESARRWEDPYARNRALRSAFRAGRYDRERAAADDDDLRARLGLAEDLDLLPAAADDARRAALVDFGPATTGEDEKARKALARPLFASGGRSSKAALTPPEPPTARNNNDGDNSGGGKPKKRLKSEVAAAQVRVGLVSEIVGNTRAAQDPFLVSTDRSNGDTVKSSSRIPGIKRKRPDEKHEPAAEKEKSECEVGKGSTSSTTALVEYDSD